MDSKKPLPAVSVYLNNTSSGTITSETGQFTIANVPAGKFKLVASCIGYTTYVKWINPRELSGELLISLSPLAEKLQGLDVQPTDPDGWNNWGKLFKQIFIGTTPQAFACEIINPEIIKFRVNPDHTLSAFADQPIQVKNNALGYEVKYKMEEFEYDFDRKIVVYNGYTFFTDLSPSHPAKAAKWAERRKEVYEGSLLHFMRSYFVNNLAAEGFEMRNLGKIPNPVKNRARNLFRLHKDSVIMDTSSIEVSNLTEIGNDGMPSLSPYIRRTVNTRDSTDFYKKALLQPDSIISNQLVYADSIGFAVDSATAGFYFPDSLQVSYLRKEIPGSYKSLGHKKEPYPISQFVFINRKPVYVLANGSYYGPHDLKITGYWAWWETISTMLPFDYMPQ